MFSPSLIHLHDLHFMSDKTEALEINVRLSLYAMCGAFLVSLQVFVRGQYRGMFAIPTELQFCSASIHAVLADS